ncbi:MAG: arylsulfatase [Pseudomonadales bacterium]|nr:arylsulfatase [Pseudomonadales bacterium]
MGLGACSESHQERLTEPARLPKPIVSSDSRPNFLLVVVDDLGYSDLSSFGGGEIATAAIDRLALEGVRLNTFYTAPTCSPTRAALLSGNDPHIAGLGNMAELLAKNQRGKPGYEGHLNQRVISIATLLRDAGYFTAMTGKWHLGLEAENSPATQGFEHSYALLHGGAGHFDDTGLLERAPKALYREDGKLVDWPKGRYSSDFYTEKLIDYLSKNDGHQPFFAYLAFSAVHWPLQAPDELIRKYKGRYDAGWDVLRKQRLKGLRQAGLLTENIDFVTPPGYQPWDNLSREQQRIEARKMEVFAAMLDNVNQNIERLVSYLEKTGTLDNTVIIFLSDNGAEGTPLEKSPLLKGWLERFDNSLENMGRINSYIFYGPNWAHATTAPSKYYKSHVAEGGIHVPAFIWRKGMAVKGAIARAPVTVMDIAPTLLEMAMVEYPKEYQGKPLEPLRGLSLQPLMDEPSVRIHPEDALFGLELFGRRAIRQGQWKITMEPSPFGTGEWELYDLSSDKGETHNVAKSHPDLVARLAAAWQDYADEVGVILPEGPSGY